MARKFCPCEFAAKTTNRFGIMETVFMVNLYRFQVPRFMAGSRRNTSRPSVFSGCRRRVSSILEVVSSKQKSRFFTKKSKKCAVMIFFIIKDFFRSYLLSHQDKFRQIIDNLELLKNSLKPSL